MDDSITFAVAVVAGLLSFLSPCVLPLVPAYLGFVTGMSLDELRDTGSRRAVLVPAVFFVSGFTFVFLLMGASASLLGQLFLQYRDLIARIGGIVILIFGLHLLGVLRLQVLMRERRFHFATGPKSYVGSGVAGIVFAAGWSPCIGPVLGALWTWAGVRATMWSAMLLLGGYSLGLAIPFLIAALATGFFLESSRRLRRIVPVVEKASGAILVGVGLLLVSGWFLILASFLARLTPAFLLERI
jgi:cytochrome c-type biogenesis protein